MLYGARKGSDKMLIKEAGFKVTVSLDFQECALIGRALRMADTGVEAVSRQLNGLAPAFEALAQLAWERYNLTASAIEDLKALGPFGVPEGVVLGEDV